MACSDRAHTDLSFRGAGSAGCVNLPALRLGRNDERKGLSARPGRLHVMVITTAAAATNRTAITAVSTAIPVANVLIRPSRRARKAARWGGTVGIAGRDSMTRLPQQDREPLGPPIPPPRPGMRP